MTADDVKKTMDEYPGSATDWVYRKIRESIIGAEGLPLSVQVIGRPWTEEIVIYAMKELESCFIDER